MSYIEVKGLEKEFVVRKKVPGKLVREKTIVSALANVSFSVERGELLGYIGPNGAGKSTTVKILSGILTPDGGQVTVDGRVPYRQRKEHVRHIGVVFGQRTQLWWDVPPMDSYLLLKDIYRLQPKCFRQRLEELTETLDLGDILKTPLRQLSLGQRMRAELCGSLLHSPELLFLDEPTIGLDAVSKIRLREFLKYENQTHRTTVILTTHDMEDIAALCSRVMVLGHGRLLYDGKFSDLLSKYDTQRRVRVRYSEGQPDLLLPQVCRQKTNEDGSLTIDYPLRDVSMEDLLAQLQKAGTIQELTVETQNIDSMIAKLYEEMRL